jgi:hypothetical protein
VTGTSCRRSGHCKLAGSACASCPDPHAVNHQLRDTADEFVELDPYFDYLTRTARAA